MVDSDQTQHHRHLCRNTEAEHFPSKFTILFFAFGIRSLLMNYHINYAIKICWHFFFYGKELSSRDRHTSSSERSR